MPKRERVEITLESRWAYVTSASKEAEFQLREYYSYFFPGALYDKRYKLWKQARWRATRDGTTGRLPGWDGRLRLYQEGRLSAGLFRATKKDLERQGFRFQVDYKRPAVRMAEIAEPDNPKYIYQCRCVNAMCRAVHRGGGIILVATGGGKTKMAADFFGALPEMSCLFVVDTIHLLHQTRAELEKWIGEEVGMVGEGDYDPQRVTVATIQTLSKHSRRYNFRKWYDRIQIMVVDELHEQMGRRNFRILEQVNPIAVYGLTATLELNLEPVRLRAWAFCGPVIFRFPIKEATEKKVVTGGKVLQLLFPQSNGDIRHDYPLEYATEVTGSFQKAGACRRIVEYLVGKKKRYVMVLADRIQHVDLLANRLPQPLHAIRGAVKTVLRRKAQRAFEKGIVRLLIASRVFKKGANIIRMDAVIDMAEGNSKNDALQKYGRAVRLHAEKSLIWYIDVGTVKGRFRERADRRRKAFEEAGVPVESVAVAGPKAALNAVRRFVRGE